MTSNPPPKKQLSPEHKLLFVHEQGACDDFQSAWVTTTACWLARNQLRYFPAAVWSYFEPLQKTRMCSVEALGIGAGQTFSADCQSSVLFAWWLPVITTLFMLKQHLCWLPVITIVSMMTSTHHYSVHIKATLVLTASHQYCSHDYFQSLLLFPWWLPVITIVPMITSSHHCCSHDDCQSSQLCPRGSSICADYQSSLSFPWWLPVITTNAVGGIPCEEPIGVQWLAVTSHSCWLEAIGLLAHVWIKISPPGQA